MNRSGLLMVVAVTGTIAGAGAFLLPTELSAGSTATEATAPATRASAPVTRRDLTEVSSFDAAASYGDEWKLVTTAAGIVTWRPDVGTVVEPGAQLIRVNDKPLFLARGDMPMHRAIARVPGGQSAQIIGDDVRQLQEFLRDAGFDENGELRTDGVFDSVTERAIRTWQLWYRLPVTGSVDSAQVVFSPTAVRIASAPRVGQTFDAVNVTVVNAVLSVDITDEDDRALFEASPEVEVELPDGTTSKGRIDELIPPDDEQDGGDGTDASKWRATITVDLPAGTEDGVRVTITKVHASQALTVPVSALLAPADGGFAVEIVDGATTRLVRVEIGAKAIDGIIDITGDIAEGDEVVIPS